MHFNHKNKDKKEQESSFQINNVSTNVAHVWTSVSGAADEDEGEEDLFQARWSKAGPSDFYNLWGPERETVLLLAVCKDRQEQKLQFSVKYVS